MDSSPISAIAADRYGKRLHVVNIGLPPNNTPVSDHLNLLIEACPRTVHLKQIIRAAVAVFCARTLHLQQFIRARRLHIVDIHFSVEVQLQQTIIASDCMLLTLFVVKLFICNTAFGQSDCVPKKNKTKNKQATQLFESNQASGCMMLIYICHQTMHVQQIVWAKAVAAC